MAQRAQMFQLVNYRQGETKPPWIVAGNLIRFWREPWNTLLRFADTIDKVKTRKLKEIEQRPRLSQSHETSKNPISNAEKNNLIAFLKKMISKMELLPDELYVYRLYGEETDQFEFYNSEYINMCNNLIMFLELSLTHGFELESWIE